MVLDDASRQQVWNRTQIACRRTMPRARAGRAVRAGAARCARARARVQAARPSLKRGWLMILGTWLFTKMRGELVGTDAEGNRYYQDKRQIAGRRRKRWVMYNGVAEASRV